jgi:uncharacterized Zn finger protein (UPF0148 family)
MGWKNIKEAFRIKHTVSVTNEGICIGSHYIHDIIVIRPNGVIAKSYQDGYAINEDLDRIQGELDRTSPMRLRKLIQAPDTFAASIPVYTYDGGEILTKHCEELGWPNVTHDGDIMYENGYSTDRAQVIEWAKENARLRVKFARERKDELRAMLTECYKEMAEYQADLSNLELLA